MNGWRKDAGPFVVRIESNCVMICLEDGLGESGVLNALWMLDTLELRRIMLWHALEEELVWVDILGIGAAMED